MSVVPRELLSYGQLLDESIASFLEKFKGELPERSSDVDWAFDVLEEYSLRPSKRIRGSLAGATYDYASKQQHAEAGIRLGAAIEIVQNYLLIVDDVMDRSATRRGQPTVHELHGHKYRPDDIHQSNMAAIQVGLLANCVASSCFLDVSIPSENIVRALLALERHMAITGFGQIDDMHQAMGVNVTEDDLLRKYKQKSSYYSFVDPIETALLLAGKDSSMARLDAEAYGIPAGVAFQLRDDYLGIFGDTDTTGKANLDDIREGKYTLMMHYALEAATAIQAEKLISILGDPAADSSDLDTVRAILEETGASERAMKEAHVYAARAGEAAREAASWDSAFGDLLGALVDFSVERTR